MAYGNLGLAGLDGPGGEGCLRGMGIIRNYFHRRGQDYFLGMRNSFFELLHQLQITTLTPKFSHVRFFFMHGKNWVGTTFFLLLAMVVLLESFRLGVGTLRSPQAGFFPFFAGAVLGLLSILSFFSEIKPNSSISEKKASSGGTKFNLKVVLVLVSLIVYGLLLDVLGFILCTAAIIIFWLKIVVPQRAFTVIASAIFIPLVAYFLFYVWLRVPLPKGFLTF